MNSKNIKRALSRAAYAGLSLEPLESRMLLAAEHGLSASFYNSTAPGTGPGVVNRVDQTVDFYWGSAAPATGINTDKFSARWTGQVVPRYSESYTFTTRSDEAVRLWVNGQLIIDDWTRHSLKSDNGTITLQAGKRYDLKMEYFDYSGTATARLMWASPTQLQEDVPSSQLYAQGPYTNPPATTDTRIEAENYDLGNNSVAYSDSDAGNTVGAYRSDDVDIESTLDKGAGYDIAYQRPGEWLEYSIDVPTSGVFDLDARLASKSVGASVHFEVDDVNVSGAMAIPGTGSWQAWTTLTKTGISLAAGRHVVRFVEDVANKSGYVSNFNWFQFRRQVPQMTMSTGGNSITSGQATPIDLGATLLGAVLPTQTFTVTNAGNGTLTLGTPTLPAGYTLLEGLNSTLTPGASDTFTIALSGSTRGTYAGAVSITSNDPAASPFTFGVTSHITAPQIAVSYNGGTITSGSSSVDFGTLQQGDASRTLVFTVINQGDATLTLATPTLPAGFTLVDGLSTTIAAGGSDTFSIAMTSDVVGDRGGNITFVTNDLAASAFIFAVAGTVVSPTTAATNPVLLPGAGWTGPTDQPAAINATAQFGDAKAIARWDVVPYQTFTDKFNVGVVAFHAAGIDHVSFSVNNGAWQDVYQMTVNPQTNVNEYWATLDATKFATDGQIEVRAIAYPKIGVPRVLGGATITANGENSLFLNTNAHGSLASIAKYVSSTGSDLTGDGTANNPYLTIFKASLEIQHTTGASANNGTIYLLPGEYNFAGRTAAGGYKVAPPVTSTGWLTITSAPGVPRGLVKVISSSAADALSTKLVHLDNLTVSRTNLAAPSNIMPSLWLDSVILSGNGRTDDITFASATTWTGGIYMTDSSVSDVSSNVYAAVLERNVQVHSIASQAFFNDQLVINSSLDGLDNSGTTFHPDVVHFEGTQFDNMIVYGLRALHAGGQGIFSRNVSAYQASSPFTDTNIAIVNALIEMTSYQSDWSKSVDHLLLWNITQPNRNFRFGNDPVGAVNASSSVSIRNSVFNTVSASFPLGSKIDDNHFIVTDANYPSYGTNSTSGDPLWRDATNDDFTPGTGSPLLGRVTDLLVTEDLFGNPIAIGGAIGAMQ